MGIIKQSEETSLNEKKIKKYTDEKSTIPVNQILNNTFTTDVPNFGSKKDNIVKQTLESTFRPQPRTKYLDTIFRFPSSISSPVNSSGAYPLPSPPIQPYVAVGYVAEGYV